MRLLAGLALLATLAWNLISIFGASLAAEDTAAVFALSLIMIGVSVAGLLAAIGGCVAAVDGSVGPTLSALSITALLFLLWLLLLSLA